MPSAHAAAGHPATTATATAIAIDRATTTATDPAESGGGVSTRAADDPIVSGPAEPRPATANAPTPAPPAPPGAADRAVVVRGVRLRYREWGRPGSPVALVLPGVMGHAAEWDPLAAALARTRRVVALDHRGHGLSDWAPPYSIPTMAEDAAAALEALGVERAALAGHSLGAQVGCLLAAERPDLVERLALIDPPLGVRAPTPVTEAVRGFIAHLAAASHTTVDEALAEWASGDPLAREEHLRRYVENALAVTRNGRLAWRFDAARLGELLTDRAGLELVHRSVARVRAPVLLLRGERSALLTPEAARAAVRRFPRASLVEVPGAGHDMGVQRPEAVVAAVEPFLAP